MKKTKCTRVLLFCLLIFINGLLVGCSNNTKSAFQMTELDREFDNYARNAAEELLAEELEYYNVKTSELKYLYTFYDSQGDEYITMYGAKFDEELEFGEVGILINVYLNSEKTVEEVESIYCDAGSYESYTSNNAKSYKFKGVEWKNINN